MQLRSTGHSRAASRRRSRDRLLGALFFAAAVLGTVPLPALTFTEIMYYPPGAQAERNRMKFIEIFNDSPTTVDISRFYFAEGIRFVFPEGTLLGGKKYLVLCADEAAIRSRYGITNTIGNFEGNLSEDGDELVLYTEGGGISARVDYRDRGKWSSVPAGTGHSLSLAKPYLDAGAPESWVASRRPGGTPGAENFPPPYWKETEVFGENTPWLYKKGWDGAAMAPFSDPPEAWWDPAFDDAAWQTGETSIGHGDNDDRTILDDMVGKYVAFAARKKFTFSPEAEAEMEDAVLRVRIDDGFIAYLNGEEIGRINVGTDGSIPHDRAATATREATTAAVIVEIPRSRFVPGQNILAVQVHNRSVTDNDVSFFPSLVWRKTVFDGGPKLTPIVINEVIREGPAGRALELFNPTESPIDLDGMALSDDSAHLDKFVIPAGRTVPGRGFAIFTEAETGLQLYGTGPERVLRLFLMERDLAAVNSVLTLETRAPAAASGLSQGRFPDGGPRWLVSHDPTPMAANQTAIERDVVINEIMYNPLGSPSDTLPGGAVLQRGEFIELFNRSNREIPIGGWTFTEGYNFAFPAGSTLAPGEFLVVAPDPQYIRTTYSLPAAKVVGPEPNPQAQDAFGVLSNGGETIELKDALGNLVQEVRYREGGEWSPLADGGGSSLELIDPRQDNTVPGAWGPSDETSKAPWKEYTYEGLHTTANESEFWIYLLNDGECLIDDVSVERLEVEYIPNGGFESPALTPWRVDGTHIRSKRTTTGAHTGQACLHLHATGGGDNRVNRVEVDTNPRMPTSQLKVTFWARWLKGSRRLQTSAYNNNSLAVGHLLDVPANLGTPGAENSLRARLRGETGSDNLGPVSSEVRHAPAVPKDAENVQILARVSDSDGVESVQVEYRFGRKTAPVSTADLFDDGLHGDGSAGDGLYGGEIPGHPLNAKVLFNIAATDKGGRIRRHPPEAPARTLLYQVTATYESPALRYRIVIDDENYATLTTRRLHSDDLVDTAFVFEESEVYYNVGIRYHGSPWNRPGEPKMFRVRFNEDKPMRGFTRFNISRYGSTPNEGTAYELNRRASAGPDARTASTPRYNYLKFYFNGRPHSGTALAEIVPPSAEYMRANFPNDSDGFAYKITGKLRFLDNGEMEGVDWTQYRQYGSTKESYRYYYNPSTRGDDDEFQPLMDFLTILDPSKTPLAKFEDPATGLDSICNVDAFLRVFAIRVLQDDWDTIGIQNGQNAYVYYAPIEGKFYLLPWDLDHTFGDPNARFTPAELNVDVATRRWLNDSPKYRRMYYRILQEVLNRFWSAPAMSPWLDAVAAETKVGLVASPSAIKSFMTSRASIAKARIPQLTRVVPFAITNPRGSQAAVKGKELTISGTAPLDIAHFFLAKEGEDPAEIQPTWTGVTGTDWRLALRLAPNETMARFQIFGIDIEGDLVGGVLSLTVHDSTGWAAPSIAELRPASGPVEGGTAVSILGAGFQAGVTVNFGARSASDPKVISPTEIRVTTPAAVAPGPVDVNVVNLDAQTAVLAGGFAYGSTTPTFLRGDFDGNLVVNLTDPIALLNHLFLGDVAPACPDAADFDDTGVLNVTDPIFLLDFMFLGGPRPPAPFPAEGADPTTDDGLDC